jgi:hypothetical protein
LEDLPGLIVKNLLLLARHLEVVHHVPGRIRVRVLPSALKYVNKDEIEEMIRRIPGIISLKVNPIVGSVVIEYNKQKLPYDLWTSIGQLRRKPELSEDLKNRLEALWSDELSP